MVSIERPPEQLCAFLLSFFCLLLWKKTVGEKLIDILIFSFLKN